MSGASCYYNYVIILVNHFTLKGFSYMLMSFISHLSQSEWSLYCKSLCFGRKLVTSCYRSVCKDTEMAQRTYKKLFISQKSKYIAYTTESTSRKTKYVYNVSTNRHAICNGWAILSKSSLVAVTSLLIVHIAWSLCF